MEFKNNNIRNIISFLNVLSILPDDTFYFTLEFLLALILLQDIFFLFKAVMVRTKFYTFKYFEEASAYESKTYYQHKAKLINLHKKYKLCISIYLFLTQLCINYIHYIFFFFNLIVCLCWSFTAQSTTRSCRTGQLIMALFLAKLRPFKRLTSTKPGRPLQ